MHRWAFFSTFLLDSLTSVHNGRSRHFPDIFRQTFDLKKESKIPVGKGIFSHKDLVHERELIYTKFREKIEAKFKRSHPEGNFELYLERIKKDDFTGLIDDELRSLINLGALFIGIKVNCRSCRSNKWYSLREVQNKMECLDVIKKLSPILSQPTTIKRARL